MVEFCVFTKGRRFCWREAKSKIFKAALRKRHDLPNLTRLRTNCNRQTKRTSYTVGFVYSFPDTFYFQHRLDFSQKKFGDRNFRGKEIMPKKHVIHDIC